MKYLFKKIEPKWQAKWEEAKVFEAKDNSDKPKFYGLVEFPYPSGAGMHVGHIKAYSSLEVISRKRRMEGYNVLFPIGFDAFGLPTENYAVKTGTHPRIITDENIKRFSNQLKKVGFSFDWNRVIDTTDEDYYKWTQWIFLKMFEKGLVFRDRTLVNYCPHCKVVLSNEDSQGGKCDICHSDVVQKSKDVWYLRITQYADKLLEGLKDVDYPDNVKQQQIHWIGKSKGAFVNFDVDGIDEKLEIYTTRPDTLFGVTFMVIAPEHPIIDKYADKITNMDEITAYRNECAKKTEFERTQLVKDKTGVRIQGLEGINPVNGKKIPIYIADYVMMGYGTGAIMAVPAHDQRDYDFAKKFGIDIIEVIKGGDITKEAYTGDGEMVNSDFLNGYTKKKDSIERMLEELEKKSGIIFSNSPTQSVGYYPVSELAKVRHTRALLSLEKTKQIRELADFMENQDTLLMLKLDGLTVKLVYEEGRLVQASTRGDGNIGEDITHNIPAFENIPLSISYRERLVTTGEAFIYKDDFRQLKDTIRDGNGEPYKNARNLASGSVRNLNPEVCKGRHVHFIPFNVLEGIDEGTGVDSREFKLMQLGVLGFDTCPYVYMEAGKHSEKELKEQIEKLKTIASEKEIPIDGLVLIYDNLSYSSKCGKTGHHYKDGLAYKFEDETYETTLQEIEWTPSRSGDLAPVLYLIL